jgi:hypothetical protein
LSRHNLPFAEKAAKWPEEKAKFLLNAAVAMI